jgi:hypothetical protein
MFNNDFLTEILGFKKKKLEEKGETYELSNFIIWIFI